MKLPSVTVKQLLEAGVHLGHKTFRWNPKMEEFIFGSKNSIHIIDLVQTLEMVNRALLEIHKCITSGGKILFVSTKKQAAGTIANLAKDTSQFYVNHRWLGGMLTNWKTISNSINRLNDLEVLLNEEPRFVRPINYPAGTPGQGSAIINREGLAPVGIINAQGNTFMRGELDNPFRRVKEEIKKILPQTSVILLDFHAEATSEKIAMARMLDGEVSAVIGTHTHVQTADEFIFPGGTAFLCDAGFTGPHDGVLGRDWEPVVERFLTSQPRRFPVAKDRILLQGVVIEIDGATGKATGIKRVSEALKQ